MLYQLGNKKNAKKKAGFSLPFLSLKDYIN